MKEVWKSIKDYKGLYEVSSAGNVKSLKRTKNNRWNTSHPVSERILKAGIDNHGYEQVRLCKNGVCKMFKVHRIVADTFKPSKDKLKQINHLNGIKTDNRVENLEWCTSAENTRHAWKNGLCKSSKGENHGRSKLLKEDVLKIRKLRLNGASQKQICTMFPVSYGTIGRIIRRELWSHI